MGTKHENYVIFDTLQKECEKGIQVFHDNHVATALDGEIVKKNNKNRYSQSVEWIRNFDDWLLQGAGKFAELKQVPFHINLKYVEEDGDYNQWLSNMATKAISQSMDWTQLEEKLTFENK